MVSFNRYMPVKPNTFISLLNIKVPRCLIVYFIRITKLKIFHAFLVRMTINYELDTIGSFIEYISFGWSV